MSRNRRPLIAGTLSFLLPGLGLLYIGHRAGALINFTLATLVIVVINFFLSDPTLREHIHWTLLAIAACSAGYAHGIATAETRTISNETIEDPTPTPSAAQR